MLIRLTTDMSVTSKGFEAKWYTGFPESPTNFVLSHTNDGSDQILKILWTKPINEGSSNVTKYVIRVETDSGYNETVNNYNFEVPAAQTRLVSKFVVIKGMRANVWLSAENEVGEGPAVNGTYAIPGIIYHMYFTAFLKVTVIIFV